MPAVPFLLTCGPFVFSTFALARGLRAYKTGQLRAFPLWMAGTAWLITAYAAYTFVRYTLAPAPNLPPWKDPQTLNLALLFLLAPIGVVATVISGVRGATRWVVLPLLAAMLVLFFVGVLESSSV